MFIPRVTSNTKRRWPWQVRQMGDRWEKWWLAEIDYPLNTRYSDQESSTACYRSDRSCLATPCRGDTQIKES